MKLIFQSLASIQWGHLLFRDFVSGMVIFLSQQEHLALSGESGFIQPVLGLALHRFSALHQAPEGTVMHTYNTRVESAAIPTRNCHSFSWTTESGLGTCGGAWRGGKEGRNTLVGWLSRKPQGCIHCLRVYSTCTQRVSIFEGDVSICFLLSVLTVVQSWKTCQQSSGTMPQCAMP